MEFLLHTPPQLRPERPKFEIRKVDLASIRNSPPALDLAPISDVAYGIVAPVIVTFGLIGNILILIVVGKSSMKGAIAVSLSTLAIFDTGALISSIPFWILRSRGFWCSHFSAIYYAHLELFIMNSFVASSIFNVIAMTIERYTSVCWPEKFQTMHTPNRAKIASVVSFVLAVLISLPLTILKFVNETPDTPFTRRRIGPICRYEVSVNQTITDHYMWTVYVWFGESCVRFIPAIVLAVLNTLIIIKFKSVIQNRLKLGRSKFKPSNKESAARHLEQERKLVTLLTSIIILFFITNVPSAILSIIYRQELEKNYAFAVFRAVANLLEISNFALNFVMYCFFSREFRKMLREVFPCWPALSPIFDSRSTQTTTSGSSRTRSAPHSDSNSPPVSNT